LNNKLKVLDLFSGIGGFSLGLHSTGIFDTVKFVEFDKFCQKVLQKNFKDIPIEGDIRDVKGEEFEADVITGGFPCQPFSVAGKQKGTNDNRYLWPEMFRLIKEIKPEFVIGENVQGLINLQDGMVLRQVQDQLEGEGFEVQCFLIPASGIGAWHQRNRVWIIGHSKHNGLLASEKRSRDKEINGGTQKGQNQTIESKRTSRSRDNEDVSNTTSSRSFSESIGDIGSLGEESQKEKGRERSESTICTSTRSSKGTERNVSNTISELSDGCSSPTRDSEKEFIRLECNEGWDWQKVWSQTERCSEQDRERQNVSNTETKRLQRRSISTDLERQSGEKFTKNSTEEQHTWWQTQSNLCGVPNGISRELDKDRSNRIKSLGNAIVPQCARILGLAIKQVLIQEGRE
jgi:DNA (cytosine-5)-methyltransferase 1